MSEVFNNRDNTVPLHFYVVHRIEDKIHGWRMEHKPAWQAQHDYDMVYKLEGREAAYWIATNDASILRPDAISFALSVHTGKVRIFSCDLVNVVGRRFSVGS